jgi:ATP-dependent RNA helicase RhlE
MKFSDYYIDQTLKSALEELGFKRPTDIQFKAIQPILDGEDVMAVAQTGTGKTAAFVIPVLQKLIKKSRKDYKGVRCLVMVPTRELAKQIAAVFQSIGKQTPIKTFALIGGVEQEQQIRTLKNGIDVLVTTPGRMFDLISQGALDVSKADTLVLDEADLMLDFGFAKDIKDVLKFLPKHRQTLFFTATISTKLKRMAYDVVKNPIRIQLSPKNPVAKTIDHAVAFVEMDDKRFFLENMLNEYPEYRFIVFVRTKVRVERVVAAMERVGIHTEALHGGVEQKARFVILDRFRTAENRVLVTTDVAARGIDIPSVDYVINYDLPDESENYVHRCGRTGRGNNRGQALSFCSELEITLLEAIEEYTGESIVRYELHPDEYKQIIEDAEDPGHDWKKLISEANKEDGTEDCWD